MDLHDLLTDYEQAHQSERPATTAGLTASATNRYCERQTAYALQGEPETNPRDPVTAATVGTLLHDVIVGKLWPRHDPDAIVETRGEHGQADVIRADAHEIRDLKTVNRTYFDRWAENEGPPESVWQQVAIYAHDVNAIDGWTLVIDTLCRDTGRTATYRRRYTDEAGRSAVILLKEASHHLKATAPAQVEPNGLAGPDWVCDRCPWLNACLALQEAAPYPHTDETLEDAAALLLEARAKKREAEAEERAAKAVLRGFNGRVGPWRVKWTTSTYPPSYREGYDVQRIYVDRVDD